MNGAFDNIEEHKEALGPTSSRKVYDQVKEMEESLCKTFKRDHAKWGGIELGERRAQF